MKKLINILKVVGWIHFDYFITKRKDTRGGVIAQVPDLEILVGGLIISWFVGYRLPGLEYNNQKVEAAFRKDLVLGEDDKVNYAQTDTLWNLFTGIRFNYQRLYLHMAILIFG